MKICNFRPLCVLALIVIFTVATCLTSLWLTIAFGLLLTAALYVVKLPTQFKITTAVVFTLTVVSFLLTTWLVPNPYYHTFDPDAGLRGVILRYADWYLHKFLSADNAALLYGVMFGDKSGLPFILRSNFTIAGLGHVLAVSGLHVGLLAGVLTWLLKTCKVPRRAHLWVITPILLFYAYLCGWQYSILRAVIMFFVYMFVKENFGLADPLSCLSCAAIVILVLFPYALVSASFLLSFACVLGIDLMYDFFLKHCYVKAVALYLSVTIASFPFVLYFFKSVPLYGLLTNVVLVPLLIFCFYLGMFAVSTFVMGTVLWVADPLLTMVRSVSDAISKLPFATVAATGSVPAIIIYLVALILLSRFIFLPRKVKYPLAAVLFTCYFVVIMV